jgi:hypothetical protein
MGMQANEVGNWLRRQHAGRRDHREAILDDDVLAIMPGPHFDWFMKTLVTYQATPAGADSNEEKDHSHPQE